jgi:hypothetical protein
MPESVKIFLSTVSAEFRPYRDQLRTDFTRHNVEVKVQEDFVDLGGDTLDELDVYIAQCDAVVRDRGVFRETSGEFGVRHVRRGALGRRRPSSDLCFSQRPASITNRRR